MERLHGLSCGLERANDALESLAADEVRIKDQAIADRTNEVIDVWFR